LLNAYLPARPSTFSARRERERERERKRERDRESEREREREREIEREEDETFPLLPCNLKLFSASYFLPAQCATSDGKNLHCSNILLHSIFSPSARAAVI
jgi:hypothetical protein